MLTIMPIKTVTHVYAPSNANLLVAILRHEVGELCYNLGLNSCCAKTLNNPPIFRTLRENGTLNNQAIYGTLGENGT